MALVVAQMLVLPLYLGYAAIVYWRLRTSSDLDTEIAQTRSWVRCTPPWHLFADLVLPALPLIAELTCVINGLLWPVEMITRPWRSGEEG